MAGHCSLTEKSVINFSFLSELRFRVKSMKPGTKITAIALVLLLALGYLVSLVSSVGGATVSSDPAYKGEPVVGLVIKYRDGVNPVDLFGNQVALNLSQAKLIPGDDLGLGMHSAKFSKQLSESQALVVANQIAKSPDVDSVFLDHLLTKATFNTATPKLGVLKATAAPTKVAAKDAWSSTTPKQARITLSWAAPTKLNGGQIWGYRISKYDKILEKYVVLVSNTKTKTTSLKISTGLIAGGQESFKVAAITKTSNSKYMAISKDSLVAKAVPTAIPQAPVLQSSGNITSANPIVSWVTQGIEERGGLAVNYSVKGTAADESEATCSSSSVSCTLSGLEAGKRYQIVVTATNARGSSSSLPVTETLDPMKDQQWYLDGEYGINASKAWKITKGSPSIVVAVLDTGMTDHPDLNANVVTGYDFISDPSNARDGNGRDANPADPGDYVSSNIPSSWHGTHVAGIIAAESNEIGISGVAPNVKISPVRVLGVNGGSEADIAAGINWAIGVKINGVPANPNPAKVVNLSIGSSTFSSCSTYSPTQLAIDESKKRNVTLVTAAGNDNQFATNSYPGNCYGNITIGATGITGDRSYYSNYSGYSRYQEMYIGVDISAPGGDDKVGYNKPAGGLIWSTLNDGKTTVGRATYGGEQGTSMASPIAAGVVALMYSVRPTITYTQVWQILSSTARPFNPDSDCEYQMVETMLNDGSIITTGQCGIGIIDANAALLAVQKLNK
jgi:serine protease